MEIIRNNPYLLLFCILTVLNLFLWAVLFWQFRRYRKIQRQLLAGEEGVILTDIVLKHKKALATHNKNLKELGKILEELLERNEWNIQKIGLVRFNPFPNSGGNMSFALALLDGRDNGIVISSLHGREGTRIYAKSMINGKSEYHLTDEEKEAIRRANQKS